MESRCATRRCWSLKQAIRPVTRWQSPPGSASPKQSTGPFDSSWSRGGLTSRPPRPPDRPVRPVRPLVPPALDIFPRAPQREAESAPAGRSADLVLAKGCQPAHPELKPCQKGRERGRRGLIPESGRQPCFGRGGEALVRVESPVHHLNHSEAHPQVRFDGSSYRIARQIEALAAGPGGPPSRCPGCA